MHKRRHGVWCQGSDIALYLVGNLTARRVAVKSKHNELDRLLLKAAGQVPVSAALGPAALRRLRVQVLYLEVCRKSVPRLLWWSARGGLWNTVLNVAKLPLNVISILKTWCV